MTPNADDSADPLGWPVRLFNTLTRQVADFVPASPPDVGIYTCGPTVYADQHIGNMRAYVFADTLKRALTWKGYRVRHVINITDVGHLTSDADEGDDKLEAAARREHANAREIAERYTRDFKTDLGRLRIIEPDVWCKATDHIQQMIGFAEVLDAGGWCYQLPSGLYFDTSKIPDYGALSRLDLAGQQAGARVDVAEGKRNPADFAVWRTTPPGENRQMEWDSPWGRGAPGWHLECSVMSMQYLGPHFDIHTGGVDHIPVHHTERDRAERGVPRGRAAVGPLVAARRVHQPQGREDLQVDGRWRGRERPHRPRLPSRRLPVLAAAVELPQPVGVHLVRHGRRPGGAQETARPLRHGPIPRTVRPYRD